MLCILEPAESNLGYVEFFCLIFLCFKTNGKIVSLKRDAAGFFTQFLFVFPTDLVLSRLYSVDRTPVSKSRNKIRVKHGIYFEKKKEYNLAARQPFMDFQKACDSVRREVLCILFQ
jgi:hypothetical protein